MATEGPKRFGYYARLSSGDKRIYRKSDEITSVPLPGAEALFPLVVTLAEALELGKRVAVAKAANALCGALFQQLNVSVVRIRVREVRPTSDWGELHGLYTFAHDGKPPEIEVWMRTAAHRRTVKFKTFLRTLLHEVAHHLDLTLYSLGNSFHTVGFFRRESSLSKQLLRAIRPAPPAAPPEPPAEKPKRRPRPVQLSLFGDL